MAICCANNLLSTKYVLVLVLVVALARRDAVAAEDSLLQTASLPLQPDRQRWAQLLSWKPRSYLYHNFLTEAEVHHIKNTAAPFMKRSTVAGEDSNGHQIGLVDEYRTSYGMFIRRDQDPIIQDIINKVAEWAMLPPSHFEDMQVLRYGVGQEYRKHQDSGENEVTAEYGPRLCTVLLYLNDVLEGGETAFPDTDVSHWADAHVGKHVEPSLSACAQGSVAYKPKKGDALMFWSFKPDGVSLDEFAMHTGCPPISGVKWTAPLWIHSRPFRPQEPAVGNDHLPAGYDPGVCQDRHALCKEWAAAGECERNRGFMLGGVEGHGSCLKACKLCTVCAAGDRACYENNRRRAGYLVYTEEDGIDEGYLLRHGQPAELLKQQQQQHDTPSQATEQQHQQQPDLPSKPIEQQQQQPPSQPIEQQQHNLPDQNREQQQHDLQQQQESPSQPEDQQKQKPKRQSFISRLLRVLQPKLATDDGEL